MADIVSVAKTEKLYTNPKVLIIAIDAMLIMLGFGIIAPSMSFYLFALEGQLTQPPGPDYIIPPEIVAEFSLILGIMMASFMGTRTLLARYWGGVSDMRGRKPILNTGLLGYVVLLVLFGFAQNWIHLLIIRALQGVVSAMTWPVAEAALMDIVGIERRGEGLGLYMVVSNIGFITGPGVGGLLYNFCRDFLLLPVPDVFRVPYFIAALITLPAAIFTAVLLKETAPGKVEHHESDQQKLESDMGTTSHQSIIESDGPETEQMDDKTRKMVHALYVMAVMNGIAMGLGQPIFQLFLMSKITTDIGLIGLVISGAGAIGMLFSIPAGRYADKKGRKGLAVWGAAGARVSYFALPLTTNLAQTSIFWIAQNASFSVSQPAMRAIQADVVPWNLRGKLFGTIQACFNAGATIGPLAGGWLFGYFSLLLFPIGPFIIEGLVVPFWLASILGMIGVFLLWKYVEETHPSQETTPEGQE
ncbi:MAG: MFS transporter [Candidatus Lokiarchaeota archaeon]|nr:MFS transporter [Candidatus Lokiarchaeota archaeon]